MSSRRSLLVTASAGLAAAGCAALSNPAPQPSPSVNTDIVTGFTVAQVALAALVLIPGIGPAVVTGAQSALSALQAAYASYTSAPAGSTTEAAALQAAIAAANEFLQSVGEPALAASAQARAGVIRVVR